MSGKAELLENVRIGANALIKNSSDYMALDELGKNASAFRCSDGSVKIAWQNAIYTPESFRTYIETLMPEMSENHLETLDHVREHFDLQEFNCQEHSRFAEEPLSLDDALFKLESQMQSDEMQV